MFEVVSHSDVLVRLSLAEALFVIPSLFSDVHLCWLACTDRLDLRASENKRSSASYNESSRGQKHLPELSRVPLSSAFPRKGDH